MRIHLDNVQFGASEGPHRFGTRLARELITQGHEVELVDGRHADASVVFIEPTGARLNQKFVVRLDGIWAKSNEIQTRNELIRNIYSHATGIIFQSHFDRAYAMCHIGDHDNPIVIHNGAPIVTDVEVDDGIKRLRAEYDTIFVCSANWHRAKRLKENTQLFENLRVHHPNSALVVMGRDPDHVVPHPHVFYTGSMPEYLCLQMFHVADWMIHLAYFEHCPNTVVEALSQGCPVITTDVGGTHEIVKHYGVILKEPVAFDFSSPCEYDDPPDLDLSKLVSLPHKVHLGPPPDVDIAQTARQYVQFLETL